MSLIDAKFGRHTACYPITLDIFCCDCAFGDELEVWRSLLYKRFNVIATCVSFLTVRYGTVTAPLIGVLLPWVKFSPNLPWRFHRVSSSPRNTNSRQPEDDS
jgi:hypothetical protein